MAQSEAQKITLKDGSSAILRSLKATDAEMLQLFFKQIANETTFTWCYPGQNPPVQIMTEVIQSAENAEKNLFLGVFIDQILVGVSRLQVDRPNHPWAQHVGSFALMVLKSAWGKGIGSTILNHIEEFAERVGVVRLEAEVRTQNIRGYDLYRRLGYSIEGTLHNDAWIDGFFQSSYKIAKMLGALKKTLWTPPTIVSERLMLRPFKFQDAARVFEYASNPRVSLYTTWLPHQSIEDSENFIRKVLDYYQQERIELAIVFKNHPEHVVGSIGAWWINAHAHSMEIGYALDEKYWNQGIMSEAVSSLLNHLKQNFVVKRIQARCKTDNQASSHVMKKAGMQFEGTLRSSHFGRDQYWDLDMYSIIYNESKDSI